MSKQKSLLIKLQSRGNKKPVCFVHPVGGGVFCYVTLARLLGNDQPFYAIQAAGLEGEQEPFSTIEEMANHYIKELRVMEQEGPYIIGGWSFGGIVAFEMANQLQKECQETTVILLDSYRYNDWIPFGHKNISLDENNLMIWFINDFARNIGKDLNISEKDIVDYSSKEEKINALLQMIKNANVVPASFDLQQIKFSLNVFQANVQALARYNPTSCINHLLLIRAKEMLQFDYPESKKEIFVGWNKLAKEIDLEIIDGDHYTVLAKPNVQHIIEIIKAKL